MATKKVYDQCCAILQKYPHYTISVKHSPQRVLKPDMQWLFGKKLLVNQRQFRRCSESEQRRQGGFARLVRFPSREQSKEVYHGILQ